MTGDALEGKRILLGITGSIAAYKAPELIRLLRADGIRVTAVMTEHAMRFITPLLIETVTGERVLYGMFDSPLAHIESVRGIDAYVIAPATANTISKLSCAMADNILTASFLAASCPKLIAPAMNSGMYLNQIFREGLNRLTAHGVIEIRPESGKLACGDEGVGRMAETRDIALAVERAISVHCLSKKRILISAGPTREPLDPVRFISNRSSGKMGYALASAAYRRGGEVTLVSGPVGLSRPYGVEVVYTETAEEMKEAVLKNSICADIVIMAAAVSDYRPMRPSGVKEAKSPSITIDLIKNDDIIMSIDRGHRPFMVGFSAQTGPALDIARRKLIEKDLDMIVFNDLSMEGAGFDTDTNIVTIIDRTKETPLPKMSKMGVADKILDNILLRIS